jgi:hypothetical protein
MVSKLIVAAGLMAAYLAGHVVARARSGSGFLIGYFILLLASILAMSQLP